MSLLSRSHEVNAFRLCMLVGLTNENINKKQRIRKTSLLAFDFTWRQSFKTCDKNKKTFSVYAAETHWDKERVVLSKSFLLKLSVRNQMTRRSLTHVALHGREKCTFSTSVWIGYLEGAKQTSQVHGIEFKKTTKLWLRTSSTFLVSFQDRTKPHGRGFIQTLA